LRAVFFSMLDLASRLASEAFWSLIWLWMRSVRARTICSERALRKSR
jgi:hypothetical protein